MPYHVVRQGDHLARIAHAWRTTTDAIWGASQNDELRALRGDGHLLSPGDLVWVPEPQAPTALTLSLQSSNSFVARVPKTNVRVRLAADGYAIADEPWKVLDLHGVEGTTDDEGEVSFDAPVTCRRVRLLLTQRNEQYDLELGGLDPIDTISGVQARLRHLGWYDGTTSGVLDDATRTSLQEFQRTHRLTPSGRIDGATTDALRQEYGC